MTRTRRHAAARYGLVASGVAIAAVGAILAQAAAARAEGEGLLLLPIVRAMALGMTAVEATRAATAPAGPVTATLKPPPLPPARGMIPSRLYVPDGYALDDDRTPRMFAAPVNADRVVGFDVFTRPARGLKAELAYDEEKRGPFPGSGDVVRFEIQVGF